MTHTNSASTPRVWLITGASRGLGRAFADAALAAGDQVAALARPSAALDDLQRQGGQGVLTIPIDVTDRSAVFAAVDRAATHFGRIDIVINNAGSMWLGAVEEFSEHEARAAMETNFFGALWVTQAVIPQFRSQRGGRLLQISSVGGVVSGPTAGMYSASKFALEGMSEALAQEVAAFGVKVTIVEPGGYWTEIYRRSLHQTAALDAYAHLRPPSDADPADGETVALTDSDPRQAAPAIMTLVDSDDPPLRLVLGSTVLDAMITATRERIETWERWRDVSRSAEHLVPMPAGYLDAAE